MSECVWDQIARLVGGVLLPKKWNTVSCTVYHQMSLMLSDVSLSLSLSCRDTRPVPWLPCVLQVCWLAGTNSPRSAGEAHDCNCDFGVHSIFFETLLLRNEGQEKENCSLEPRSRLRAVNKYHHLLTVVIGPKQAGAFFLLNFIWVHKSTHVAHAEIEKKQATHPEAKQETCEQN